MIFFFKLSPFIPRARTFYTSKLTVLLHGPVISSLTGSRHYIPRMPPTRMGLGLHPVSNNDVVTVTIQTAWYVGIVSMIIIIIYIHPSFLYFRFTLGDGRSLASVWFSRFSVLD